MNVLDTWDKVAPADVATPKITKDILQTREWTFSQFAHLESNRGFLMPTASMGSAKGQEMARMLLMRCLEELTEARDSQSRMHHIEELIDAWNYLASIFIFDPYTPDSVYNMLSVTFGRVSWGTRERLPDSALTDALVEFSPFLAKLRNRPWQNNAQSLYFDGWSEAEVMFSHVTQQILKPFKSFREFHHLFLAKDSVLRFRLQSKY